MNPILLLTFALASIPAMAASTSVIVSGDAGQKADAYLTASGYTGAVLVARKGEILLRKGYGQVDREKGMPMPVDVVYSIGSITKQFTAAAILKLEMAGKLSVQDAIGKYFKDVPDDKKPVTLHHLLTHSAGLASDFAPTDYDVATRDDYVRRILASKLRTKPGESYHYANSGYSLLGAVVEIVSGQGYEAYLREHLFLPAGMKETGYLLPKWPAERVAKGYDGKRLWGTILDRPWDKDGPYWQLRANGGIHTTLDDMHRWHLALLGESVLSAQAKAKAFTPHIEEGPDADSHYGYGWALFDSPWGGRLIAHDGGNRIFSADFRRYVDQDLVVLTFANDALVKAFRVSEPLARIAMGETVAAAPPAGAGETISPLGETGRHARIRKWFDAFNSGDYARVKAFRDDNFDPGAQGPTEEKRLEMFQRMTRDLGQVQPEGVLSADEESIEVRSRAATGMIARLRFFFRPGPDGKLTGMGIQVGD